MLALNCSGVSAVVSIRGGYDQTLALDACKLQFLYQAFDASVEYSNYNAIPWRLGLLTAEQ